MKNQTEFRAACPICGAPISGSAADGLCPRCLLRGAVQIRHPTPVAEVAPPNTADGPLGRLGDYELLEKIAQGGMGVVYKARQVSLNRLVALKLILAGRLATQQEVRRFQTEAEAAARLDHPNIVPIYEVGEDGDQHFFVMKLIEGQSLADWARRTLEPRETPAPTRSKLKARSSAVAALVAKITRAVHHAHQRGVLHRDLKPANILLDAHGEPHVTDFGLARLPERDSGLTLPGAVLGTPSFMAPEQAAGAANELTTAADVFSLGAILYFLLTGRPPFEGATAVETLGRVMNEEPRRPGWTVSGVDPELETICLKCLEKDPSRRYASALLLAEDLERWQRHEPILARPPTVWTQTRKWIRRHPASAALVAVSALSILGFVALLGLTGRRLEKERNHALAQEAATRRSLYAADIYLAQRALVDGNLGLARRALEAHRPEPGREDLRGFEWRYLWSRCQGDQIAILRGHGAPVSCVAFSPDGRLLASGGDDARVLLWDLESHALRSTLDQFSNAVVALAFSPDGQRLTVGTDDSSGSVWNLTSGSLVSTFREKGGKVTLAPDGSLAAFSWTIFPKTGREDVVTLFDTRTGATLGTLRHASGLAAISHNASRVVAATHSGFQLWDPADLSPRETVSHSETFSSFAFSRDDRSLAALTYRGRSVTVWEITSARLLGTFAVPEMTLMGVGFSPGGRRLVACGSDQSLHLWELESGRELGVLRGHVNEVRAVTFSPDGALLASAGKDGTVRLWPAAVPEPETYPTNIFPPCVLSPDGQTLAAQDRLGRNLTVQPVLWQTRDWVAARFTNAPGAQVVAFLPDSADLLMMVRPVPGKPLWLARYSRATQEFQAFHLLPESDRPRTATDYSARADLFALASYDGEILVWRAADGVLLGTLHGPSNEVQAIRFSPDGRRLASFTKKAGLTLWDPIEGHEIRRLRFAAARAYDLEFSPNGRMLAAADSNNAIEVWDVSTGEMVATFTGHAEPVTRLAFTPDNRTLASASEDGTVKLWSLGAERELATVFRGEPLAYLEFAPDGSRLLGTSTNGHLRVWQAPVEAP